MAATLAVRLRPCRGHYRPVEGGESNCDALATQADKLLIYRVGNLNELQLLRVGTGCWYSFVNTIICLKSASVYIVVLIPIH